MKANQEIDINDKNALVIFKDCTDMPWLRILSPGFRHCFVVLKKDTNWIIYEPLSHCTRLDVMTGFTMQTIIDGFEQRGMTVVSVKTQNPPPRMAPIGPYSCVEAVKRILGLHARWILTPRQLYNYLTRAGG